MLEVGDGDGTVGHRNAIGAGMTTADSAASKRLPCDVLVIGSGAGGLSAAVTAAWHGLNVIIAEKEPVFGGTTAWSGGWMWVPRNPLARRAGIVEDAEQIRTYLRHEIGNRYDAARIDAFLEAAPHMVGFFERHTALQFIDGNKIPDMHGKQPGAALGGRSVCAAPFDGSAARSADPQAAPAEGRDRISRHGDRLGRRSRALPQRDAVARLGGARDTAVWQASDRYGALPAWDALASTATRSRRGSASRPPISGCGSLSPRRPSG